MKNEDPSIAIEKSITDSYADRRLPGQTVGTVSPSGVQRHGSDVERAITIDNEALRLPFLLKPGWGRQGIAYGPYRRRNGLTLAVFMLNGQGTSPGGDIQQSLLGRSLRWVAGSGSRPPLQQLFGLAASPHKQRMWRRWQSWANHTPKHFQPPPRDENIAVGWFPRAVPVDPMGEGNPFIVHGRGLENGELWTRVGKSLQSAFKGLQNLPVYYVVILREKGAAYYACSVPNAFGLTAYPDLRPLAIDPFNSDETVYAAIYQNVLGQVGFSIDTRVYGTQIVEIPRLARWYGTAQGADRLVGQGSLNGAPAEVGGKWRVFQGDFLLSPQGAIAIKSDSFAVLNPRQTSGLIHALIETSNIITPVALLWRVQDDENFWCLWLSETQCQLQIKQQGKGNSIAVSNALSLRPNTVNSVQILDDGNSFNLYLNGKLLFDTSFGDLRFKEANGVGFAAEKSNERLYFRDFEVHPRSVDMPNEIDLTSPWGETGKRVIVAEDFAGKSQDLTGKPTTQGDKVWQKELGKGRIKITGKGRAKVQASWENPNPGRTAYTLDWDDALFADVEVDLTPPKLYKNHQTEGRGGLMFWQDKSNYMIVANCLSAKAGASISSFFCIDGFEDVYDAVWTPVGDRIRWGVTHNLRVIFDGMNYRAFIDDEPVLYRALTDIYPNLKQPLLIRRIGLVVNSEWGGDDMGTIFKNFMARV
ncbi:nucleotide-binding protein [Capilliphycus salinus ALCB114379]|uniref:nucleotide-binding protein n=1 Tax=Capilliphycus salinus TaxID=2768948 RepID=UPI0039A4D459